jgi:hypothetical protein
MSMIFILIEIKFDIDINNDELLLIIWEHNKEENCNAKPKYYKRYLIFVFKCLFIGL